MDEDSAVSQAKTFLKENKTDEAYSVLKDAANKGDNKAQFMLAMLIHNGRLLGASPGDDMKWMRVVAESGDKNAQFIYSDWFETEKGELDDTCIQFLRMSAESGHASAAQKISMMELKHGNYDKFIEVLRKAAGFQGTIENYFIVLHFPIRKIMEITEMADGDYLRELLVILAEMIDEEIIEIGREEIVEFYEKYKERGFIEATYGLGIMCLRNMLPNSTPAKAFDYFKEAADAGLQLAHSRIGQCYLWGVSVEKSLEKSFTEFEEGAKSGNYRSLYAYGHFLGMLAKGKGYDSILRSAESGYPVAEMECYRAIKDGKMDDPTGFKGMDFLEKAAKHGLKEAEAILKCTK